MNKISQSPEKTYPPLLTLKCMANFNPQLTTDDECTRHATLATCYQLEQSVLKIGFVLAKKVGWGEVGGFQHGVLCTRQLPWLAVEKP